MCEKDGNKNSSKSFFLFCQEYDYSLDMWSFGCMLASMVRFLLVLVTLYFCIA